MKQFQITVVSEKETPDGQGSIRFSVVETVKATSYRIVDGYLAISSEGLEIATYAPNYWCSIAEAGG
jgi:hypothetical protein